MNAFSRFFVNAFGGFFDKRLWATIGTSRTTASTVEVSEESALNYSAVWCATRLLCGTGASLPLPIYSGDDETREKDRKHPAWRLLNVAPNNELTAFNFRSVMWQWQVNWGNAYAEIVREGQNPDAPLVGLYPLHPSRVKPMRDESEQLYYEVHNFGREPSELEPWQVLHLPSIITHDGLIGRGVIQHARETIGAGIAAEKYGANWFGGAAVPKVVIEHPGKWNDETRNAFRREWKEIYGGFDGDRIAVLQGGAVAKPLSLSAEDSQFLETRQFDVEEIARWYGIPPHLLQHLLRATFNNVEELGIDFVRYGLVAWLEIWEQSIRQKLFTAEEQDAMFAEHNVDALMRGNAAARANFYTAMTNAAIMTRNECRKLENLDPVEGGDVYLVQGAMVPLDEDGKPESEFVNPAPTASAEPPDDLKPAPKPSEVAASIQRVISKDLSRMLTKESNAMAGYAKRPGEFMDKLDAFYESHQETVADALSDTVYTFNLCGAGYSVDAKALAASWVGEGRNLMLEAAGIATPSELPLAVQKVVESKTWSDRPIRAVERMSDATVVV